jgi:hypothetical protein
VNDDASDDMIGYSEVDPQNMIAPSPFEESAVDSDPEEPHPANTAMHIVRTMNKANIFFFINITSL